MPKIGYGSNKNTKFMMPNGLKKVVIRNASDLEVLLMASKGCAAEIAHNVSARNRLLIVKKSKDLNIKLTNPHARLVLSETK